MDHQPDVQQQKQPQQQQQQQPQQQRQQQQLQEPSNIVYVQNSQNFHPRNQHNPFIGDHQSQILGNQSFQQQQQQQNANFGQFENHYPYLSNGNFSPSNSSSSVIPNYKTKQNVSLPFRNTQYITENGNHGGDYHHQHHQMDESVEYQNPTFQNYQQQQFFINDNQYINDMLVPTCQSSGSSEASDDSSISNASQQHFTDSMNSQLEFTVPIPLQNQRNYHGFHQKDFSDNYMGVLQDPQIPRCDSIKSETAESTCSSLSSGSTESQPDDNLVRLPVLVNPGNNLNPYQQQNTHNSINTYPNQIHHNQVNELIDQRNFNDVNKIKCNTGNNLINNNSNRCSNQLNNLVVMFPNRLNKIQNFSTTNQNTLAQNPSSASDVTNPSKLIINQRINQNQRNSIQQQKVFNLINVNQTSQDKINIPIQLQSSSMAVGNGNGNNLLQMSGGNDNSTSTSHLLNSSDSSVINTNFVQNNKHSTNSVVDGNKNDCAMLLKETSDKCISQCISDVNSSMVNSNNVYLVKTNQSDLIKNNCYDGDSSASSSSCLTTTSNCSNSVGNNILPVPVGWRRLLVAGQIIYLSPSNIALSSIEQVKIYLQTMGTCKCGLECPINCDSVFNFNPKVISRPWDSSDSELTRLCNHKRKATMPIIENEAMPDKTVKIDRKEVIPTKRKKKHGSSYSGVSVSQLLAQRDRALAAAAAANAAASRWPSNVQPPGNFQNIQQQQPNQYQNLQVLRNQTQETQQQVPYNTNVQGVESFKQVPPPPRLPDDKPIQFPCVNVPDNSNNNPQRDGDQININGQLMTNENHQGMIRTGQINLNQPQRQDVGAINHPVNYNQSQEFMQVGPRPEGVVLTPQGMIFPPNMIMQRPRSIPPWHQGRLGMNNGKKQTVAQAPVIYERVPSLQQHMPPPNLVFEDVTTRKKHKSNSKVKKRQHEAVQNQPSFMDDPNAYLAQQTALLHNTISRPNFNMNQDSRPNQNVQNQQSNMFNSNTNNTNQSAQGVPLPSNVLQQNKNSGFNVRPIQQQRAPNENFNHVCCNDQMYGNQNFEARNQMNEKIRMIQENLEKSNEIFGQYDKCEWRRTTPDGRSDDQTSSSEENPVTSSTEKTQVQIDPKIVSDTRPIQGGAISTSNGSPQPQPSPNFRQDVSSPRCSEITSVPTQSPSTGNVLISSSTNSPFAVPNNVYSPFQRENDNTPVHFKNESSPKTDNAPSPQIRSSYDNFEDNNQKYNKFVKSFQVTTTDNTETKNPVTSTFDMKDEEPASKNRFVRTMASGHTVSSNTITSVLAGKAQTATVTVNNNNSNSLTPPTTISLVNITNQNVINVPITQKANIKSPLEMVQSVVSSIQTSTALEPNIKTVLPINNILTNTTNITTTPILTTNNNQVLKPTTGNLQAGHILVSSNGQYIVASNGNIIPQTNISGLKLNQTSPMPPLSASPVVTNVTGAVTQVLPAVGVAQQVLGQPTVLVNTLPAPFVIQPGVMAVDTGLGHLAVATGNVLQSGLMENSGVRGLISPDKSKNKKASKKRKNQVASIVQMASPNNVILNQPFNQQNFAVSPGGSIQPLQALTLVPGKHGGPAQIVMNNQNNFNQFNSQPQQINLLQPVNLASVQNFPSFQQFIVPGLGNMVMSTDGTTTILPDTNIGVQLQLQNVNGQNVLTPVQNTGFINSQGILTTPAGMLIRAPNNQQKIIQNNSNPQFLSPNNGQFLVNQFQGQLSPLIATNLSPNQQIFTNSPPRQSPQEFIQIIPTSSAQNTTVVQQNTTIVQQQTTMVSNNQNILNNNAKSNFILNNANLDKPIELQIVANPPPPQQQQQQQQQQQPQKPATQEKIDIGTQHSVSTQTIVNKDVSNLVIATNNTFCQTIGSNWSGSPPDTTTHSPVESNSSHERAQSPGTADVGTDDCLPQAMVQYVSSSINENENDNDAYLIPGIPNLLNRYDSLSQVEDKGKGIVESSTILQDSGIQIQIGGSYVSPRHQKSTIDESVVSSHTDISLQDKHIESQTNNQGYQEDKGRLTDSLLSQTGSNNFSDEGKEEKQKLVEGDLVWGSARGCPAWPGKLVRPVSPDGRAWVRWFGGHISSPTRVHISQLQSLSQGLEAHHKASNKGRKNRKLNIELEAAIQEAMLELDKMTTQKKKLSANNGRPRRSHR